MRITPEYLAANVALHKSDLGFGGSGHKWAVRVMEYANLLGAKSVLDYGCGKGTLKKAIAGRVLVFEYDPAIPGLDQRPAPRADLVVCTDVLEHVELECLDAVINDLVFSAGIAVFVAVACRPGRRLMSDGKYEHRIVENEDWWAARLFPHGFDSVKALRTKEYAALARVDRR